MFDCVLPDAGPRPRKQQEFHSAFGLRCACINQYVLEAIGTLRSEIKKLERMPHDFIQSEPQRPSPQPSYFSGGLRRGFTFGLSARRSLYQAEQKGNRLPRPERRGLRVPWGQCGRSGRSPPPQILGGSPGSGPGSSSSRSLTILGAGRNTVSRFFTLPLPLSFCANGFQHSEQISYSLPSISFSRQSLASPQRSQIIMDSPP